MQTSAWRHIPSIWAGLVGKGQSRRDIVTLNQSPLFQIGCFPIVFHKAQSLPPSFVLHLLETALARDSPCSAQPALRDSVGSWGFFKVNLENFPDYTSASIIYTSEDWVD